MKDLMIGKDSAVGVLETGGVGEGRSSGGEPREDFTDWASKVDTTRHRSLLGFDESNIYLEEAHLVTGSGVGWNEELYRVGR